MNRLLRGAFGVAALLTVAATRVWPQTGPPAAEDVEAAYLYQFGRYVEWPPNQTQAGPSFYICILGTDPFGMALDELIADKMIAGRDVAVRRILGVGESRDCRIIFISPSEGGRLPAILNALEGTPVVTVGRGELFIRQGGMLAFTVEERKVRFIVNLAAAEASGLRLSSQLLRVAIRVEGAAPP